MGWHNSQTSNSLYHATDRTFFFLPIICLIHKTLHLLILITEFLQWCFYWELIRLPTLIVLPLVQYLDDYLLTNIWPVILVRHLLGTFRLQPTNTYNIGCGILPLGMKDFCMEMCTQYTTTYNSRVTQTKLYKKTRCYF